MHMMFVDESGDPGYPPTGNWLGWGGSTHFARVGVVIHGWRWKTWHKILMKFKNSEMLTWNAEIKASDIRSGQGVFMGWDRARRDAFLIKLLDLVGKTADITLLGVVIDKRAVDTSKGARLVKPEVRSLEFLLERYNLFLDQQRDKSGVVILDPVSGGSDDNLRYFQSFLLEQSAHLKPLHIVEGTFFVKSHTSNMMQIADVCTNVFYREMVRGGNSPEYAAIKPRFWRHQNRLQGYGVKKWP
jgi:hypothetical protein